MKLELSSIKKIVVRELNNENLSRYTACYIERKKYFFRYMETTITVLHINYASKD